MLLETKQPALALAEFEASQQREPNRYPQLSSAPRRRRELSGNRDKAASYYQKLLALAKDADTPRPELASAKQYRSAVSASRPRFAPLCWMAALAGSRPIAAADPEDSDPDLAKRTRTMRRAKRRPSARTGRPRVELYRRPRSAIPTRRTCRTAWATRTAT
jgi:hypothetical protein